MNEWGGSPPMTAQPQGPQTQMPTGGQGPNPFFGSLGGYTPLPYQAFGAIPQVAGIDPGAIGQYLPGFASATAAAMEPQFKQQSDALNSDLASRGIFNSGAANASQGNLLSQQFGQVLGQSLPYAQQDVVGNQQTNAANAAMYGNITQGNQNLYNNWQNQLYGGNLGYGNQLAGGYMNTFDPSGAGNLIGQGMGNASGAYQNAYNQGLGAAGPLGSAFTDIFSKWGGGPSTPPGPYSGDYTKD